MKKNVLVFGLILGAILCVNMFYMVNQCYNNPDFKGNDAIGWAFMFLVFSLIYFGVRNYRNKELDGVISFGKAFKTGTLIALAASTLYVVVWLFYYYLFVPDFLDHYIPIALKNTDPADLAKKAKEMADFREKYKSPAFVILVTYFEVLPVGIMVTLISAILLKRKSKPDKQ